MKLKHKFYKVKGATLIETIIASVIILISYGYFILTYVQLNKPDANRLDIQTYYEQKILSDSIKASHLSIQHVDGYSAIVKTNTHSNTVFSVVKGDGKSKVSYKSFYFSNE